ncbi:hypothetical protein BV25DRAFT_1918231 [Artomyces pyxidatus]|uniref:Uncharacterized protein n=1 Tax=Artomyces pyxidatus TaxID=48021 RepID=A0ACB8SVI1_9AGAM|nr:hypothetical protein BV25DRAFT_1918231 [Artomyces pyxidatus]
MASPTTSTPTDSLTTIPGFGLARTIPAVDTCMDISICRTRYTIIWSSLVTILACVWTAVHRNVPEPERAGESRIWRIAGRVWEAAKIMMVTVLVPEWVLALAVRQLLNARAVKQELEWARSGREQKIPRWMRFELRDRLETARRRAARESSGEERGIQEEKAAMRPAAIDGLEGESTAVQLAFDMAAINKQNGRLNTDWTTRHGFSVIMGGFHYYMDGQPQCPMTREDVVVLVHSGDLVPPSDEEIRNWSQNDVLSKTVAIVQTLWFVVQAIARRMEGLPIMQLEVVTLAYTTITVAMYVAWWDKPQNVGGPVRVAVRKLPVAGLAEESTWYQRIYYVIGGLQDELVDLRKERRVPTFYSGGGRNAGPADVIAFIAAIVFGAVHCAAWNYAFPSDVEKLIWRVSSFAIVALPTVMLVPVLILVRWYWEMPYFVHGVLFPFMFTLSAPLYITARLLLLALSFSTLRSLPPDAYRAVEWTLRIPHFT